MDIDDYGRFTEEMWMTSDEAEIQDGQGDRSLAIMTMGLAGEVGEVVEPIKKLFRDGTMPDREMLKKELGDVVYYWARICKKFGFQPSEVLTANVEKLKGRRARGTVRGSGNDR